VPALQEPDGSHEVPAAGKDAHGATAKKRSIPAAFEDLENG